MVQADESMGAWQVFLITLPALAAAGYVLYIFIFKRGLTHGLDEASNLPTIDRVATEEQIITLLEKISDCEAGPPDKGEVCAICLESFDGNNLKLFTAPICHHPFHILCIGKWLHTKPETTCPICKAQLIDEHDHEKSLAEGHSGT
uniref:RING-type domain-containing protein n=1 Tax=Rhodosorus marinus TaxID=101924 RepID=A0A7S2ZYM3_9RHOD|mmetsp:Transcript_3651/g.16149  ORF Transcript_3651/g.16149 Transcript_3651/m.16149 type:complete len:146 (+) Transcript_3651:739-1176(+)|eukprot:CAMPEP_0113954264 /NCGR_PEP_ID=MMETSP0011_2-20120614/400_1 /TAXON_ID=101924 /ORGANISM="Rhodosorus marinus" /LENGTH=145 /DNA_ID=CAMNT_0000963261 /DNA_START=493 /DNA_END=930 /DNA_ORIENTATION=+ /assembly_acc=CAM_ASM_000156